MKCSKEIIVNLPRNKVIELFDKPDKRKKLAGLLSFDPLGGEPGKEDAKSKLVFDMNGIKIEIIETITKHNLPDKYFGAYRAKGVLILRKTLKSLLKNHSLYKGNIMSVNPIPWGYNTGTPHLVSKELGH